MMMKKSLKQLEALVTAWKSNNFFQARIKLTFLYLLIITGILIVFSAMLNFQIEKNLEYQFQNIQLSKEDIKKQVQNRYPNRSIQNIDLENENGKLLYTVLFDDSLEISVNSINGKILSNEEASENFTDLITSDVQNTLWIINLIILFISSFLGYFLAGKTLSPIEKKTKQQKQFISDAAHELRNPLTAIFATCESMIRVNKKEGFEEILEESERLIKITENLLVLDQIEKKSQKSEINLKTLIENIFQKIKPLATEKKIIFENHLDIFNILADKNDVEKIIFNLFHNAIKFSHQNQKIIISLKKNGEFSVQDFGIGIYKKDISKIFNRFYKADTSRSFTEESGSGLGLSIVKEICDRNNWNITVTSREKKGSTFIINF